MSRRAPNNNAISELREMVFEDGSGFGPGGGHELSSITLTQEYQKD